jgi:hypothetical protein
MWTIVFLAMGGIALGKGVMSSGLLEVVDVILRDLVDGLSLYTVVLILSPVVLVRKYPNPTPADQKLKIDPFHPSDHIHLYQSHDCQRFARPHR